MSDEILQEIDELKKRLYELTRRVAASIPKEELPEGDLDLVVVRVGERRAAFLCRDLDEVVPMARLAAIPESAAWVAGVLNLRGAMLPVLDVLARCEGRSREPDVDDFILVASAQGRRVGLVVQEILAVRTVPAGQLRSVTGDVPFGPYLLGLIGLEAEPLALWSLGRLVDTSDLPEDVA
jgi:chemotaxis signal transduction protein